MSLPTRHALTEAKVFRVRDRASAIARRTLMADPRRGWRRRMKRADRLALRWVMMWMILKRIKSEGEGGPRCDAER